MAWQLKVVKGTPKGLHQKLLVRHMLQCRDATEATGKVSCKQSVATIVVVGCRSGGGRGEGGGGGIRLFAFGGGVGVGSSTTPKWLYGSMCFVGTRNFVSGIRQGVKFCFHHMCLYSNC